MVQFEYNGELVTRVNDDIFKRPLLATDWSEPSSRTLDVLKSLDGIIEKAYVCHIVGVKISKGLDKSELYRIEKESRDRLEDYCAKLKSVGIVAEPHLGAGRTSLEIIRISRELEASMIVMGTTGKDRLHEIFMGSNSHRVAEMSELPTLLVP
jgi:nucleotide-binding universal stress UspA family protein